MQTTKQHGAETKLAEGYSQPAQQGDVTAIEVVQSAGSVATPTPAAVRGDSGGEILMAAGVSELRPLAARLAADRRARQLARAALHDEGVRERLLPCDDQWSG